jgi:hypothetical protein
VEAGLELPGFSTFDKMASKIRTEVNASIREGIHDRMSAAQRAGLLAVAGGARQRGTTLFNRLKKPVKGPTWSHFKNLAKRLEWVDGLGDTAVWMESVATGKITDFAGEADAADASELRDYAPIKQVALIACLAHKARMRLRDDLATMFCKRVATKIKKAKAELEEIRLAEREIVEAGARPVSLRGGQRSDLLRETCVAAVSARTIPEAQPPAVSTSSRDTPVAAAIARCARSLYARSAISVEMPWPSGRNPAAVSTAETGGLISPHRIPLSSAMPPHLSSRSAYSSSRRLGFLKTVIAGYSALHSSRRTDRSAPTSPV